MKTTAFTLTDETGRKIKGTVAETGGFLNIAVDGYGNCVSLDWTSRGLRLLVNADPETDEPEIINLRSDAD